MWEWIFNGIGSQIVGIVIGAILGGLTGYRIGVKNYVKQTQKAGDQSNQKQETVIMNNTRLLKGSTRKKAHIKQVQRAGNSAHQNQFGGMNNAGEYSETKSR